MFRIRPKLEPGDIKSRVQDYPKVQIRGRGDTLEKGGGVWPGARNVVMAQEQG